MATQDEKVASHRRRRKSRHKKLSKRLSGLFYNLGWFALAIVVGVPILAIMLYISGSI